MELRKRLAERIGALRREAGLTQAELAERLGLHGSYIGLLERGRKTPSLPTLERIAIYFDVELEDLVAKDAERFRTGRRLNQIQNLLAQVPEQDVDRLYRILRIALGKE